MIRRIRESDRDDFLRLSEMFYSSSAVLHKVPTEYHVRAFDELMGSDAYLIGYIIELEQKIAGYVLLVKSYSREAGGPCLWLDEIFIIPEMQGRGLGREFFEYLNTSPEFAMYARIRLETEPDNEKARALYSRMGFRDLPYLQMIKGQ